jgi:AraC-like DNA-binding protein
LFQRLTAAINTDTALRDQLVFNYVQLLLLESTKSGVQSRESRKSSAPSREAAKSDALPGPKQPSDAAARITHRFLQLLESQFPVYPHDRFQLRRPADFAGRLGVHVNHLNAMVRKVTGQTTTEHITARKIAEAKQLLHHSDRTIAQISDLLGFDYPNHFNHFFKRSTGITPLTYKKMKIHAHWTHKKRPG